NSGSLRFVPSNHAGKFADERNFFLDIRVHFLVFQKCVDSLESADCGKLCSDSQVSESAAVVQLPFFCVG
ncbi:MAG: hypothetical protein Q3Y27_04925, partial [Clostridia bacterium]|nr:hypothetical protein [Clostridia bacterium]